MDLEVRYWSLDRPLEGESALALERIFSPSELERRSRLVSPQLRERWGRARLGLRLSLGHSLQLPPESLEFALAPGGKPYHPRHPRLAFNLSHSEGWAALVYLQRPEGSKAAVGIDLEASLPQAPLEVGKRFFAPRESLFLERLPPEQRGIAFRRLWTRKEALLKLEGSGLRIPLRHFAVEGERPLWLHGESPFAHLWLATYRWGLEWSLSLAANFEPRRLHWQALAPTPNLLIERDV